VNGFPVTAPAGAVLQRKPATAPAPTVTAVELTPVNPLLVNSRLVVPALVSVKPLKVASPLLALTGCAPTIPPSGQLTSTELPAPERKLL
jgi:hypothetical protein